MYLARILPVPLGDEVLDLELDGLPSDVDEYVNVLREERCVAPLWLKLSSECGARRRFEDCERVLQAGIHTLTTVPPASGPTYRSQEAIAEEVAPFHAMLATLQLSKARHCPKLILADAKYQNLTLANPHIESKERWQQAAASHNNAAVLTSHANNAKAESTLRTSVLLGKAIFFTVTGKTDEALKAFNTILQKQARNPIALLGKACCLLRKRAYAVALKLYQDVLRISIAQTAFAATESAIVGQDGELTERQASKWLGPDPRVGIGLCLQGLGQVAAAQRAWTRATVVNPTTPSPHLLLGLSKINAAKQLADLDADILACYSEVSESSVRGALYREGIAHIETAWKLDNKNAMAAVTLAEHICARAVAVSKQDKTRAQKEFERALKLAEHAIQYADNRAAVSQAWLTFARTAHLYSFLDEASTGAIELRTLAQRFYSRAADDHVKGHTGNDANTLAPGHALTVLGLTQLQVSRSESLGAVNTVETLMSRPASASSSCLEISLLAASLRAHSHPGATSAERASDRQRARILIGRTIQTLSACKQAVSSTEVNDDLEAIEDVLSLGGARNGDASGHLDIARTALGQEKLGGEAIRGIAKLFDDGLVHVQQADLFINATRGVSEFTRAAESYISALRAFRDGSQKNAEADSSERESLALRMQANLGAILALQGLEAPNRSDTKYLQAAITQLQSTLTAAGKAAASASLDAEKTIILYNLGRVLEALGSFDDAQKAYDAVLATHPEYVDAKVCLALLTVSRPESKGSREATQLGNVLFKEAISSDPTNLDVRGAYVCFLSGDLPASPNPPQWEGIKETIAQLFMGPTSNQAAQIFGSAAAARTVSEEARHDAFTLASLSWAYYNLGHNVKPGSNAKKEKLRALLRCCDLLDKALSEDSRCAFALQGLAILAAEGSLVDLTSPNGITNQQEADVKRRRGADEAVSILTKLREVNEDSSVSICMGHAFMTKEDYERALKAYELAARKVAPAPPKPSLLQYLAKSSYHLGMSTKSFPHLKTSISYLEEALHLLLQRSNTGAAAEAKYVRYNIAVTRQKMLQMLFDLPTEERRLDDLQEAVAGIESSQATFRDLLSDAQGGRLSYITGEIVEQRILYGDSSLLRQSVKHVEEQKAFEEEAQAEREAVAARKREREEAFQREREQKVMEKRAAAEAIEAERRRAIEEARTWEYSVMEEEKPRKERKSRGGGGGKRRKKRKGDVGGSEIESSESEQGAGRRSGDDDMVVSDEAELEQGQFSDEEVLGRAPATDEEEEGADRGANDGMPRRKKKSKLRRANGDAGKRGRKEKRSRPARAAADSDSDDDGDQGSQGRDEGEDGRPSKKVKKNRMRRAKDDDLIESEEEM